MLRFLAVMACAFLALLFGWFVYQNSLDMPPEELRTRVEASAPQWPNYQEDLKGQIGAKPVAEWMGRPVSARQTDEAIEVSFEISGPWESNGLAIPVLLRDPFGAVQRHEGIRREDHRLVYLFSLPEENGDALLPWIEIQYPHHELRVIFSTNGEWIQTED